MKYLQEFEQINKYIKVLLKPLCRSDNGFLNINKQTFYSSKKSSNKENFLYIFFPFINLQEFVDRKQAVICKFMSEIEKYINKKVIKNVQVNSFSIKQNRYQRIYIFSEKNFNPILFIMNSLKVKKDQHQRPKQLLLSYTIFPYLILNSLFLILWTLCC
ncbi:hypothetical protein pb186bvf_000812 [Paramecium bursaria]